MTDPIDDLYRATAREAPSAAMDAAVLGAAASQMRRRRMAPLMALAAVLLVAVLVLQLRGPVSDGPTPGASPEETRAYLMTLQTPADLDGAGEGAG